MPMVEAIELTKVFGKLVAVDHVSFWVAEREIFTSLLVWPWVSVYCCLSLSPEYYLVSPQVQLYRYVSVSYA
ncbi:MAG: hypothetical protein RQ862_04845 [Candidatus Caldarchaeales archaeon]|nr:hypothetical protein [Candidatus Caldarchaeales archaeon]